MKIKWQGLSLLLLPLFVFAAVAAADEKVVEKEIQLDDSGEKKIIVKVVSDDDDLENLEWIDKDGEVIVIRIDEDGEHVILGGEDDDRIVLRSGRGKAHRAFDLHHKGMFDDDEDGAFLGVTLSDIDEDEAEDAGLRKQKGVRVMNVTDDGPADEGGIEAGDIITRFDGRKIEDADELVEAVGKSDAGDEVKIQLVRDGKKKTVECVLAEKERDMAFFSRKDWKNLDKLENFHWTLPEGEDDIFVKRIRGHFPQGPRLGVEIRDLDEGMAEYFPGADTGQVLVTGITEDSVAEKAGLKSGDVITAFDGEKISDSDGLRQAVREAEAGEDIALDFLRKGEARSITVQFEEEVGLADLSSPKLKKFRQKKTFEKVDLEKRMEELERKLEKLIEKLD